MAKLRKLLIFTYFGICDAFLRLIEKAYRKTFLQKASAFPEGKNIWYISMKVLGSSSPEGQSCRNPSCHSRIVSSSYLLSSQQGLKWRRNGEKRKRRKRKKSASLLVATCWQIWLRRGRLLLANRKGEGNVMFKRRHRFRATITVSVLPQYQVK